MNKKRLLKLADLLEADAKNKKGIKFDLATWAAPAPVENDWWPRQWDEKLKEVKVDCGTSACAVGLACISGAFKRSGLSYGYKRWMSGYILVPKFDGSREWPAVQKFFGINNKDADFLFLSDRYPDNKVKGAAGERYVAKRIRDFAAGKVVA